MGKISDEGKGGGALSLDTRTLASGTRPLESGPQHGVVTRILEDHRKKTAKLHGERENMPG